MAKYLIKGGKDRLFGAKKGGDGNGAVEADDTMRSKAYARVLDALSEGEIEGLVNGPRGIYLDGTALQNEDGSFNFEDVQVDTRNGTPFQDHIPNFALVENEVAVDVEVKNGNPVTRTVTSANVDALRVKVLLPQLSHQDKKTGDLNGSEAHVQIQVQPFGGKFSTVVDEKITGKVMSRYERSWRIQLPKGGHPWNVRVIRVSEDATESNIQNKTFVSSFTEVIDAKLRYPHTAIVGVRVDASKFSSIPTRAYHVKGLRIRVPSNYDPETRVYSGPWDGTFKIAYSNNPAWCLYDVATAKRYGIGNFVDEALIDKWGLYQIAKYCDEAVPDGRGGTEPRFTCNVYIQTRQDAFKVLNDMASVFRGMLYWGGGAIVATQDRPTEPTYTFHTRNVVNGEFNYSGSSVKARHTVALVSWTDLSDAGKTKVEYVEDADGIAKYGVVETEITAFGCTSQSQAHRAGLWLLASELHETETVTFTSGLEGATIHPGQVVSVEDTYRNVRRVGGRVIAVDGGTLLTLETPADLEFTSGPVTIIQPNGDILEGRGEVTAIRTVMHFVDGGATPKAGATWVATINREGAENSKLFRIVSIKEESAGMYAVTALEYNPAKYAAVDEGVILDIGGLPNGGGGGGTFPGAGGPGSGGNGGIDDMPTGMKVTITPYKVGENTKFRLSVSWDHRDGLQGWEVERTFNSDPAVVGDLCTSAIFEIGDANVGYYTIRVRAVRLSGTRSSYASSTTVYVGNVVTEGGEIFASATASGGFLRNVIAWQFASDEVAAQVAKVEVWGHGSADSNAPLAHLATVSTPNLMWQHDELEPGHVHWYKVRAIGVDSTVHGMYPNQPLSASPNVDVTPILDRLSDSFYNSDFYKTLISRIEEIDVPEIEDLRDLLNGANLGDIWAEIERLRKRQELTGDTLLRNVVVNEEYRNESLGQLAKIMQLFEIVDDGGALESRRVTLLESKTGDNEAAIYEESRARTTAVDALASDIQTLTARTGDNEAAILTERTVRTNALESQARDFNALVAQTGANATALVATEREARTTANDAMARQLDALEVTMGEDISAAITTERTARVNGDNAVASEVTALRAQTANDIRAAVATESVARTTATNALGSRIDAVSAEFRGADALVSTKITALASEDASLASKVTGVSARLDNFGGSGKTAEAKIAEEQTARINADGVNAFAVQTVSARLNNASGTGVALEQAFTAQANTNGTLLGQYSIKINSNGHAAGFGLSSTTSAAGATTSAFAIVADKFVIAAPNPVHGHRTPFQVVTSGYYDGEGDDTVYIAPGVYMDSVMIRSAAITSAKINTAAIGTLKIAGGTVTSLNYGPWNGASGIPAGGEAVVASVGLNLPSDNSGCVVSGWVHAYANGNGPANVALMISKTSSSSGAQRYVAQGIQRLWQGNLSIHHFDQSNGWRDYYLIVKSVGPDVNSFEVKDAMICAVGGKR